MNKSKFIPSFPVLFRLVKFQLSLMVTFSALTGYFLTGKPVSLVFLYLLVGVFLMAAGSSGLNQLKERDFDLLMERTKNRPLPAKQISAGLALGVSLLLLIGGVLLLGFIGWFPVTLGILNVVLYNLIYTPLKRYSYLAIIPGALVGAITPLIGWTSVNYSVYHPVILFVALFVFLWQVPHFWLILLRFGKEYKNAGFSCLPDYLNVNRIKKMVFFWAMITSGFLFSFPLFGIIFSSPLIILFVLLNLVFILLFYKLLFGKEPVESIRSAFILINSFAFLVFIVLIFGSH
jgi:protoheme IX farnesyltransferase